MIGDITTNETQEEYHNFRDEVNTIVNETHISDEMRNELKNLEFIDDRDCEILCTMLNLFIDKKNSHINRFINKIESEVNGYIGLLSNSDRQDCIFMDSFLHIDGNIIEIKDTMFLLVKNCRVFTAIDDKHRLDTIINKSINWFTKKKHFSNCPFTDIREVINFKPITRNDAKRILNTKYSVKHNNIDEMLYLFINIDNYIVRLNYGLHDNKFISKSALNLFDAINEAIDILLKSLEILLGRQLTSDVSYDSRLNIVLDILNKYDTENRILTYNGI